jgi:hypothetical protein
MNMNMYDVYDESVELLGLLKEYKYMAVDKDGKLWAYSEAPRLSGDRWNNALYSLFYSLFIRDYGEEIQDWDRAIFDVNGIIPVDDIYNQSNKSTDDELFEEIKQHLKIAREKHPEFPDHKGFGFAAIAEEGFELFEVLGRQLAKLARAVNDNKSREECIEESKDTIVTLIRLIETLREQNDAGTDRDN